MEFTFEELKLLQSCILCLIRQEGPYQLDNDTDFLYKLENKVWNEIEKRIKEGSN